MRLVRIVIAAIVAGVMVGCAGSLSRMKEQKIVLRKDDAGHYVYPKPFDPL